MYGDLNGNDIYGPDDYYEDEGFGEVPEDYYENPEAYDDVLGIFDHEDDYWYDYEEDDYYDDEDYYEGDDH